MNRTTAIALLTALAGAAHAEQFQITITDTGPQPLSPLFYSASTSGFNIFSTGGSASPGIKNIAEKGDASTMLGIAAGSSAVGKYGLIGDSPLVPGATRTITFTADAAHPYFSFAAMLGKTNDGFIGESVDTMGLQLFNGGAAQSFNVDVFGTRAWDAGTEKNTQNLIDLNTLGGTENPPEDPGQNSIRVHAGIVAGQGDAWQLLPSWTPSTQLAHIRVQAVPEPGTFAALGLGAIGIPAPPEESKLTFEETARRELPVLYRIARRLTSNPTEAEDLVGQAFLNASKAWASFSGEYPRSWLIRILTNCHLRALRDRSSRPVGVDLDPDLLDEEPWGAIDWRLCGPRLLAEVDRLPTEYRLAVVLCDIEELSYEEAAEAMEVALGTAKSRLFRGRRILRARLAGLMEDESVAK